MTSILGISAYYHDSAAALIVDGEIIAAAQEERFSRKKHDPGFPEQASRFCIAYAGLPIEDLDYIVFYDKPLLKFERLLETYLAVAPRGFASFRKAMPVWLKEKLYLKTILKEECASLGNCTPDRLPKLLFTEHHQSHAASAFFPSPFRSAAVLCLDGVGEWATTSAWVGEDNSLTPLWQMDFPHSAGLLYSAFTWFTGFRVNSGEYKLMGLAPYGEPRYTALIRDRIIDLKEDGTFRLNMDYFNYTTGLTMTNDKFSELFGGSPRRPDQPLTRREMDIASSIQQVIEEVVLRLARTVRRETGNGKLCLAGGVALNCVANGRLLREHIIEDLWIQPAAGDAGGAIGAAMSVWHEYLGRERKLSGKDGMSGSYLGPGYSNAMIGKTMTTQGAVYTEMPDYELLPYVAERLAQGDIIGWFQGRMEFGPRALGCRSILGDPRNPQMQSTMNLKIKYRESFRPFAPSVQVEKTSDYFEPGSASPYMLLVGALRDELRMEVSAEEASLTGLDLLKVRRSRLPAVTHVDYSARIQTVHQDTNPRYHALISAFAEITGCAVLVNTSFNVRGEPLVCTPEDAYRCFMRTEMDMLVMENILVLKQDQPAKPNKDDWRKEFDPD